MPLSSNPAYPPSLADWEDHRHLIKRLYVEEDRNLSEVKQILCQKYHFRASLRSYKNKLRAWGVRKYYISGSRTQSPHVIFTPELTPFASHGSKFSPDRIKEEDDDAATMLSQMVIPSPTKSIEPSEQLDETESELLTPQHSQALVKRQAGSASPLPSLIIINDLNINTQSIVMATKAFVSNASDLAIPNLDQSGPSLRHTKPFRRRKNYIWHQFQHSLTLLEQGDIPHAFDDLQRGCSMAEEYLLHPSRQVLLSLLAVMGNRRWSRHQQAWTSVVRFMAAMSSKTLGPRHPLTHITNHIRSWDTMRVVAQPAIRVMLDTYQKQLGSAHPEVLLLKQGLSVELMRDGEFDKSEALIQEACVASASIHGESSRARRNCLRRLGNLYVEQQRWSEAQGIFETIIALDSQENLFGGPTDESSVFTCQNLSLLNYRRGDLFKSAYWAQQELDLALKIYGPEDEYYKDCLARRSARLNGDSPEKWFSWLEVS